MSQADEPQKDNRGGKRKGAGRKRVADEMQQKYLFVEAVKRITGKEDPDEAKIDLLVDLWENQRGKIFICEHVFGKAKESVEITNKNEFPDLSNVTTADLERLLNEHNDLND